MPDWIAVALGAVAGLAIVGGALTWALWPRRRGRASRLADPSDPGLQYEAPYAGPPADGAS